MKGTRQCGLILLGLALLLAVSGCSEFGNTDVFVIATPRTIAAGQSSQLNAGVKPGDLTIEDPVILPIHCVWGEQPLGFAPPRPTNTLSSTVICNPVATPNVTTSYVVYISDSHGAPINRASAEVTVAVFAPSSFTLTITYELSSVFGIMSSTPGGISCPTSCSASFASGTTVILTLRGVGPPFWNGCNSVVNSRDPSSGLILSTCTLVMDADKSVSAGI